MNTSAPLPSFLRRRNGRLELLLHTTSVQDYKVCQLKYWLRHGVLVEKAVPRWSQNYGGAMHEAHAFRYTNPALSLAEVETRQLELLRAWFNAHPVADTEWRTFERAASAIRAYNLAHPTHDWEVLAVEEKFEQRVGELRIPDPSDSDLLLDVDVTLSGRKDLVVAAHEGIWVVDHKHVSEWGSDPETNQELLAGRRSFQFRGYAWAEREQQRTLNTNAIATEAQAMRRLLPVRGTIGNYVIGRKPFSEAASAVARRPSTAKPRDEHHLEYFDYSDAALDEWREQCLATAARILRDWQNSTWEMGWDRSCAHYGKCQYYDYCNESPDTREATLQSSAFRRAEPRDPATNETE